jgi:pyruvate oxidase
MPARVSFGQAAGYARHLLKELFEEGKVKMPPL